MTTVMTTPTKAGQVSSRWRLSPSRAPAPTMMTRVMILTLRTRFGPLWPRCAASRVVTLSLRGQFRRARELFYAAVENVIVPGLDSHGLSASWAWENRALALEN